MAAHVTHEVRNPLSSIGLNAELLEEELRKAGAAEASRAMLGAIQREVDRLTRVTESYLSLARLPRPEPAPVDLGRVAREAVEFHRPEAEAAGARIAVDCADGLPEIDADAGQVRQVLANLLRNALEAVAERPEREVSVTDRPEREVGVAGRPEEEVRGAGRPEPEVRVAVRPERGGLEIAVRDTGPGVPEEARARLFEPFFTTKAKGTGIGLAASQQIAIAHGGTLTCDPPSGAGACFRLWLPGRDARRPSLPTPGPSGKE
jgi:signal transduction histidine kinase